MIVVSLFWFDDSRRALALRDAGKIVIDLLPPLMHFPGRSPPSPPLNLRMNVFSEPKPKWLPADRSVGLVGVFERASSYSVIGVLF